MSPRRVLAEHTSFELQEWQAFFKLEEIDHQQATAKAELEREVARG